MNYSRVEEFTTAGDVQSGDSNTPQQVAACNQNAVNRLRASHNGHVLSEVVSCCPCMHQNCTGKRVTGKEVCTAISKIGETLPDVLPSAAGRTETAFLLIQDIATPKGSWQLRVYALADGLWNATGKRCSEREPP